MNWYIGQEIVAIRTHSQRLIIRGRTYKIKQLQITPCKCNNVDIDVGIPHTYNGIVECNMCGIKYSSNGHTWIDERNFAPLDQDISELTEILEKENVVKI